MSASMYQYQDEICISCGANTSLHASLGKGHREEEVTMGRVFEQPQFLPFSTLIMHTAPVFKLQLPSSMYQYHLLLLYQFHPIVGNSMRDHMQRIMIWWSKIGSVSTHPRHHHQRGLRHPWSCREPRSLQWRRCWKIVSHGGVHQKAGQLTPT